MRKNLAFITLMFAGLTLVPGLAHVFQMQQKMGLGPDSYRITQMVYRGWALLGSFLVMAAFCSALYWFRLRQAGEDASLVGIAFGCYVVSLLSFFAFTLPVNQITDNWTNFPSNWPQLRARWEYSHAGAALFELIAFVLLVWRALG